MDSIISEMEKLLLSGREDCNIQDIIGESAGKNIDDLLIEADKIIGETLPFFQTYSNTKVKSSKDSKSIQNNTRIISAQPEIERNNAKKVNFNLKNNSQSISTPEKHSNTTENYGKLTINKYIKEEERKNHNIRSPSLKKCTTELKILDPEINFIKPQFKVSSSLLENHNRLQIMCNRHDKFANNNKTQDQINKLKLEEELKYYKLKNNELEKNLLFKEQEIHNLENRYQQLSQHCESFLKKNIEETLKSYDFQLNELIERNMTRESQLHIIIGNLLEEIGQSHYQYRIKLSEKNKQIRNYLDQIETILDNVYKFKNNNTKI
ncbi:interaptin-like [Rhopalosiphum maidis]|uniref:interaptin-like n=1 Tax=Rhopalosiphum maidis TaxID=43146 RepID=UPI000F000809|nr:interaptin-like [Rhopalosiphum maidis]XP_026808526.1 interaptin-like [Rhopalosiphum maidis]XP_026808528.1 interaptin-like [Rhopalosiphum maidis]XP_026808529.1 interaptin-like [Rhopalosiphum maidis]XP_026808530.1 interaptin-like [Rhopalosiphum maidis]XP_026808531.1 interaptin-like [Rhopalosiphum maidis]